jgi:hypothetical protein
MLRSSKRSLSLRFPNQDLVCTSPLHHMWCLPYPYYSSWFYHSDNVWSQKLHGTEHWTQLIVTHHHIHKSSNLYLLNAVHTFISYPS